MKKATTTKTDTPLMGKIDYLGALDSGIISNENILPPDYIERARSLKKSIITNNIQDIKDKVILLYDDMENSWFRAHEVQSYHKYHSNVTDKDIKIAAHYQKVLEAITAVTDELKNIGTSFGMNEKEFSFDAKEERASQYAQEERLAEIRKGITKDRKLMDRIDDYLKDIKKHALSSVNAYATMEERTGEIPPRYQAFIDEVQNILMKAMPSVGEGTKTDKVDRIQRDITSISSSALAINAMSIEPGQPDSYHVKYDNTGVHDHAIRIYELSTEVGKIVLGLNNRDDYYKRVDRTLAASIRDMGRAEVPSKAPTITETKEAINRKAPMEQKEIKTDNQAAAEQSQTAVLSSASLIKNKKENCWELWLTTTNGDKGEKFAVLPDKQDLTNFFNNARGTKEIERDRLRWGLGEKYLDMVKQNPSLKLSARATEPSETMSQEDKMYQKFSEIMIKQLEELKSANWQKPWKATGGELNEAINIDGRPYNDTNSFFLTMVAADAGYKSNIWVTHNRLNQENFTESKAKSKEGQLIPKTDKEGNKLPFVHVNKGAESTIVNFSKPIFYDIEKHEKADISLEDYHNMSKDAQGKIAIRMSHQSFRVFNIDQTNLETARPELYKQLQDKYFPTKEDALQNNKHSHPLPVVDEMLYNDLWICPIELKEGDRAYYTPKENKVVIPTRPQFESDEHFYSNLFHEMTHSAGAEHVLNRTKGKTFGDADYAREELVAEMSAAFLSQKYGLAKYTKADSTHYLKSWLGSLSKSPDFLKTVLEDVKKSTKYTIARFDNIEKAMSKGQNADYSLIEKENEEIRSKHDKQANVKDFAQASKEVKPYYTQISYLAPQDTTKEFKEQLKADPKFAMEYVKDLAFAEDGDLTMTYSTWKRTPEMEIAAEDAKHVLAYDTKNESYALYSKTSYEEVYKKIEEGYVPGDITDDVKEVCKDYVEDIWKDYSSRAVIETPNGDVLYIQYNRETDELQARAATNAGLAPAYTRDYDHQNDLPQNLESFRRQMTEEEEKDEEQEQTHSRGRGR